MVDMADRMRVPAVRAGALDELEGQARARGDDQVVVVEVLAVAEHQPVLFRVDFSGAGRDEVDALLLQHRGQGNGDLIARSPADRHPGVAGDEMEIIVVGNDGDLVVAAQLLQLLLHLVSRGKTANTGSHNDYMCHDSTPVVGRARVDGACGAFAPGLLVACRERSGPPDCGPIRSAALADRQAGGAPCGHAP